MAIAIASLFGSTGVACEQAGLPTVSELRNCYEALYRRIETGGFQVNYRWDVRPESPRKREGMPWSEHKIALRDGGKLLYGYLHAPHQQPDGRYIEITNTSTYDGAASYELTGRQGFVMRDDRGVFWNDMYLQHLGMPFRARDRQSAQNDKDDLRWLPNAFDKRAYQIAATPELIEGDWCWLAACAEDKLWLDANHNFIIRKRELHDRTTKRLKMRMHNRELAEVETGTWLPKRCLREDFDPTSASAKPTFISELVVSEITLGTRLPDSLFRIEFPVGTMVHDEVAGKNYLVAHDRKHYFKETIAEIQAELHSEATPWRPSYWTIVIAVNALIIVVGVLLILRSRLQA